MQSEIHSGQKKFIDCHELRLKLPCITIISSQNFPNSILELKFETCEFSVAKYISSNLWKQVEMFSFYQKLRRLRFPRKICSTKYLRKTETRKNVYTFSFLAKTMICWFGFPPLAKVSNSWLGRICFRIQALTWKGLFFMDSSMCISLFFWICISFF